jgi:hypothetical protein
MAMGVIEVILFVMIVAFGSLMMSFKRKAFVWSMIAAVLFLVTAVSGLSAPIVTDASGNFVASSANILVFGLCLLFGVIGLLYSFVLGISILKERKAEDVGTI